jgi:NTP pyrophosphatase (non-canonical NTP hydrolase)
MERIVRARHNEVMDYANLIEQVERLSRRDTKSLSQKALKATEEVGELAKAVLPLEGAAGTTHRLPCEGKVIEECADLMLVAYSIMHSMGVSVEEAAQVIRRKADYWEFLQENEDRAEEKGLVFEIHLTVGEATDLTAFCADCVDLGVKPIILDLYTPGQTIKDIMTSSTFKGTTTEVVRHAKDLADDLRARGYDVVREKIETAPWHPAALHQPRRPSRYFEAHLAFRAKRAEVEAFAEKHGVHLSANMMKKRGKQVVMGTYRVDARETTAVDFAAAVDNIRAAATEAGFTVNPPIVEYSLSDTKENHDSEWIKRGQ